MRLHGKLLTVLCKHMQVSAGGHGGHSDADDAVDFRGNPVDKSKTGGWPGAGLILGMCTYAVM